MPCQPERYNEVSENILNSEFYESLSIRRSEIIDIVS